MTTEMFCMGPVGTYESRFDLSGATYELATDGANHLMITTADGYEYQWKSTNPHISKPVVRPSWKRYGRIIWQLNQLAELNGYDTVEEKQDMAKSLLDKIDYILMVSSMTRLGNARIMYVRTGVEFYYNYIGDGLFDEF